MQTCKLVPNLAWARGATATSTNMFYSPNLGKVPKCNQFKPQNVPDQFEHHTPDHVRDEDT